MIYNELVRECFFNPHHAGALDCSQPGTVLVNKAYSPTREGIALYMTCNAAQEVCAMRFKTNGNPYQIAALELLCRGSIGKKLAQLTFDLDQLNTQLNVPFNVLPSMYLVKNAYLELLELMNKQAKGML